MVSNGRPDIVLPQVVFRFVAGDILLCEGLRHDDNGKKH